MTERELCCSTKRELSIVSRSAAFLVVLRTKDSSCWYRKPKLRPPLCINLGLDWAEDTEARLRCIGSRYVIAKLPGGRVIWRQKQRHVGSPRSTHDFSSVDNHDRVSFRQFSRPPSTFIAAFLDTLLGRAPKWVNRYVLHFVPLIIPLT